MEANLYNEDRTHKTPQSSKARTRKSSSAWTVFGLLLLSAIPLIFGAVRLSQLANGAEITPDNARFFASPSPVVIHIVSAAVYALLGAFQFVSSLWRRGTGWHRWAGRLLVPCGLLVGLSGLWMTLFYPQPAEASDLLYVFRLLFGSGMVLSVLLGYAAIRRLDILQHRAWMTTDLRAAQCAWKCAADGRGLGHQSCDSRMVHPQANIQSGAHRIGYCSFEVN
jgi:uncharacterized membrane protein